ncbi:hypothetical protein LSH36_116g02018 [Paralvinella palmiformis]|uniref:SHSP domain-containing protein n=1 Tax=Paralvinella palmiformis TaxID=53620 RepID=A0AAD9NAW5_9ANNE|nr:hypothetical protein LSH36_116g02018 [Paralvinella palmiformis]
MATRVLIPRIANHLGRVCVQRSGLRPIQRAYFGGRNLPAWPWRRSSCLTPYDNFVDRQFAEMDRMMDRMMHRPMMMPWWFSEPVYVRSGDKGIDVKYNDKVFEVTMNVSQYAPEELELKVIENKLIVTGKHEETKDEHGTVASEFTRQFLIPEDVDPESIQSQLTNDGHLVIKGTVIKQEEPKCRTIKIEHQEETETKEDK